MGRPKGSKNRPKDQAKTYEPKTRMGKFFGKPVENEKPKFTIVLGNGVPVRGEDGNTQTHYPDAKLVKTA